MMKKNNEHIDWQNDPVVEEVRRARRALWKQAGGTVEGLMRLVAKRESGNRPADARSPRNRKRARVRKSQAAK